VAADAMPLDWRPWKGILRQRRQAVSVGRLVGVSHLDRFLSFDHAPADFLPLDMAMPYTEAAEPPIITAFRMRNRLKANRTIRAPTGHISASRKRVYFSSVLSSAAQKRKEIFTGNASPRETPSRVDDYLRFDQIPADFVPLDKPLPHREGFLLWR
jgi:hypothetical protein